jgi:hypothetical protein
MNLNATHSDLKTYRITVSLLDALLEPPITCYGIFVGSITTMEEEGLPNLEHIMAIYDISSSTNILTKDGDNLFDPTTMNFTEIGTYINCVPFVTQNLGDTSTLWRLHRNVSGEYILSGNASTSYRVSITITFLSNMFCFSEGTHILSHTINERDEEVLIENLRMGDLVKTYLHGYRRIVRIGKGIMFNNPNDVWNCMYEYPHSNYLTVTGGHAILCDTITSEERERLTDLYRGGKICMLDGKYVVFASTSSLFRPIRNNQVYIYYNLALEGDGEVNRRFGIWANGVMTETSTIEHFTNHNYILLS